MSLDGAQAASLRDLLKIEISRLVEGRVSPEQIDDNDFLFDSGDNRSGLGLDSLDALELAMTIEEKYQFALPRDVDFKELRTINEILAFVDRTQSRGPSND